MVKLENIDISEKEELSTTMFNDVLGGEGGGKELKLKFKDMSEQEIGEKIHGLMAKIIEAEKKIFVDIVESFSASVRADKKKDFNDLDDNYKKNMLSRYEVYNSLSRDEKDFVDYFAQTNPGLKNLTDMFHEALSYIGTGEVKKAA